MVQYVYTYHELFIEKRVGMSNLKINLSSIKKTFSSEEKMNDYIEKEKQTDFQLPKRFENDFSHTIIKDMDVYHTRKEEKAIVYIPGGGFISDPSDYQLKFAAKMGEQTKQTVYTLIYPKTPKHSRDEIVDSVKKVVHALCQEYKGKGVSIVSDSAGSAITLSVMDELDVKYSKVVFLSPVVDLAYDNDAQKDLEKEDEMLAYPGVKMLGDLYRGSYEVSNPKVSPVRLKKLKKVPALIIVGQKELTLYDARLLKDKYEKLQIEHNYYEVEEMMHDFMFYPIKEAKQYQEKIFDFLQK